MKKLIATQLGAALLLVSGAAAANTVLHIENQSTSNVKGAFQSEIMSGYAADSTGSWIEKGQIRDYKPGNPFFESGSVHIKEGQVIPKVGVFDADKVAYVDCGLDVVFSGSKHFVYDGQKCVEKLDDTMITIVNDSKNPIYGAFSTDVTGTYVADSIDGWIKPAESFTYNPENKFLSAPTINVKEGDVINRVGVWDGGKVEYVDCAVNYVFRGQSTFVYDGQSCEMK